jgi:hypothetical protein
MWGQLRFGAEFGFMYAMKVTLLTCQWRLVHRGTKTNLVRRTATSPHFAVTHVVILVDVNDSCLCHQQIAVRCVIGW